MAKSLPGARLKALISRNLYLLMADSAQAAGMVAPDRRLEPGVRRGGEGGEPVRRARRAGRVPQLRQAGGMVEELLQHVQAVGPADGVRMEHHGELPATLVLRVE